MADSRSSRIEQTVLGSCLDRGESLIDSVSGTHQHRHVCRENRPGWPHLHLCPDLNSLRTNHDSESANDVEYMGGVVDELFAKVNGCIILIFCRESAFAQLFVWRIAHSKVDSMLEPMERNPMH